MNENDRDLALVSIQFDIYTLLGKIRVSGYKNFPCSCFSPHILAIRIPSVPAFTTYCTWVCCRMGRDVQALAQGIWTGTPGEDRTGVLAAQGEEPVLPVSHWLRSSSSIGRVCSGTTPKENKIDCKLLVILL